MAVDGKRVQNQWNYSQLRRWRFDKQTQIFSITLTDSSLAFIVSNPDDASKISTHFSHHIDSPGQSKRIRPGTAGTSPSTPPPPPPPPHAVTGGSTVMQIAVRFPHEKDTTFYAINRMNTAEDICGLIAKHLKLESDGRYGLRKETAPRYSFLRPEKPLNQQNISPNEILIFSTQFFVPSPLISQDASYIMFLFEETKLAILNGDWFFVSREEAVDLAAKQIQVMEGDYDPKKHSVAFFGPERLKSCLPSQLHSIPNIASDILRLYRAQSGTTPTTLEAATAYVETARKLSSYGNNFFYVATDNLDLLCINHKEICQVHPQTYKIMRKWDHQQLESCFLAKPDVVHLKFETGAIAPLSSSNTTSHTLACHTIDAECIHTLVTGYKKFLEKPSEVEPTCLVM